MECTDVRECFSEYIDGFLDKQTRALLEEHLSGCTGCREELSSLKALLSQLRSLGPVHAPKDFLERVHDRMESGFSFGRTIKALFVPLKIKIPLELATAAATAVLVFSIWNAAQRESEMRHFPVASIQKRTAKKTLPRPPASTTIVRDSRSHLAFEKSGKSLSENGTASTERASRMAPSKKLDKMKPMIARPAPHGGRLKEPQKRPKRAVLAPDADSAKKAYRRETALYEKSAQQSKKERKPVEFVLLVKTDLSRSGAAAPCDDLSTAAPLKVKEEIEQQRVHVASLPKKKGAGQAGPHTTMKAGGLGEDERDGAPSFKGPSPRKHDSPSAPSSLDEANFKVMELIRLLEGKVLSQEYDNKTDQPRSVTAIIPASRYRSFCEKLKQVASFQTFPPTPAGENREFVPVRIRFKYTQ